MSAKQIAGFAVGPIGTAALGLVTVPTIAWAFAPEDVGRLNVFNVTVSFLLLFCLLGLDQAFVREYHSAPEKSRLLKSCFAPGIALLTALSVASAPFAPSISFLLYGIRSPSLYWLTIAAGALSVGARYLSLILRMQERGLAFSLSQLLPKAILLLLLAGLAFFATHTSVFDLLGVSVLSLLCVLLLLGWSTRESWLVALRVRFSVQDLPKLLEFGFPLIFSGVSYWALTATATFSLRTSSSLSELATYSVATSFANAAAVLQSIVSVIWTPLVFKWEAAGVDMKRADVAGEYGLALISAAFVLVGSLSWASDLLLPGHYQGVKFLIVACSAQPLLYTFSVITSVGIGVARRTGLTLINTVVACLCNIGLNIALVPTFGARGAAAANAFAFLVLFITNTEAAARVWRSFSRLKIYVTMTIAVTLSAGTALFADVLPVHFSWLWTALAPIVLYAFRREYLACGRRVRSTLLHRANNTVAQSSAQGGSVVDAVDIAAPPKL